MLTAIDTATGNTLGIVAPSGSSEFYSFVENAASRNGSTLYAGFAPQIGTGAGLAAIDTAALLYVVSVPGLTEVDSIALCLWRTHAPPEQRRSIPKAW